MDNENRDLRTWRDARRLSRRTVAFELGVTERTLANWEAGRGAPRPGDWALLEQLWPDVPGEEKADG